MSWDSLLDTCKTYLGVSDASENDRINLFLSQTVAAVKQYCGWDLEQTTYPGAAPGGVGDSGYYWGSGTRKLLLRQLYVTAVSSLKYDPTGYFGDNPDGAFASTTTLTLGTDYAIRWDGCLPGTSTKCSRAGTLERIGGVWPNRMAYRPGNLTGQQINGLGNLKIAYTAGFTSPPPDLAGAICQMVAWTRRNAERGGFITSESLGGYSYSIASGITSGAFPELGTARQVLTRYKMGTI